jgi:polysaccharide export outer membrane protein
MTLFRMFGLGLAAGLFTVCLSAAQEVAAPTATPAPATAAAPPAPQAPPTGPVHQGANVAPDYLIGPGDSLEVNVWKEPSISGTLPVRPDGMISLSLVGDMQASGLTPMDLSKDIAERLKKYINDPSVTVTVMAVNSKHIYLIGEVGKPGEEALTPGLTVLQAIATAGGLTPYANGKHVYILRGTAGKTQKIPFDYKKALKEGNLQGVTLLSGDTIVVP